MVYNYEDERVWQQAIYDANKGTGGFRTGAYLTQFTREDTEKYEYRQNITPYDNNFRTIIDANINPVFNNISRSFEQDITGTFTEQFLEDCDGKGTKYSKFISNTGIDTDTFGFTFVYYSNDVEQPASVAEAKALKTYYKLNKILPLQLKTITINDATNEIVEFDYYKNVYETTTEDMLNEIYTYKAEEKIVVDGSGNIVSNVIGDMKLYTFESVDNVTVLPTSKYTALAGQSIAKYNLDSLKMYQNTDCTFSLFHTDDPTFSSENIKLGEHSIIKTKSGTKFSSFPIEYVADKIREEAESMKKDMYTDYKCISLYNSGASSSGDAIMAMDQLRYEELASKAITAADFDKYLMDEFTTLVQENVGYLVAYPVNFINYKLNDVLEETQKALGLGFAPENELMIRMEALTKIFPSATEEQKTQMLKNEENNLDYSLEIPDDKDEIPVEPKEENE